MALKGGIDDFSLEGAKGLFLKDLFQWVVDINVGWSFTLERYPSHLPVIKAWIGHEA